MGYALFFSPAWIKKRKGNEKKAERSNHIEFVLILSKTKVLNRCVDCARNSDRSNVFLFFKRRTILNRYVYPSNFMFLQFPSWNPWSTAYNSGYHHRKSQLPFPLICDFLFPSFSTVAVSKSHGFWWMVHTAISTIDKAQGVPHRHNDTSPVESPAGEKPFLTNNSSNLA